MNEARISADLVRRVAAGEKSAETAIVEHYGSALRAMIRSRMPGDARHDDVFQETMWAVILRLRSRPIDDPEKLGAFISGVAKNKIRSRKRSDHDVNTTPDAEYIDALRNYLPSAMDDIEGEEFRDAVRVLISRLSNQRYMEILVRHHVHGEEKPWICGAMDLTPANFDRVIHRARNAVKALVEGDEIHSIQEFIDRK